MKAITVFFVILVGVMCAATAGFGIAAVYPSPEEPLYPKVQPRLLPDGTTATLSAAEEKKFDQVQKDELAYREKAGGYFRTTVFFGIAIGALLGLAALFLLEKSAIVSAGLLLGGVLTAVFARLWVSLAAASSRVGSTQETAIAMLEFVVLFALTSAVILVGLRRFPKTK